MTARSRVFPAIGASAILLAACSLISPGGCPDALLSGALARTNDVPMLAVWDGQETHRVTWPDGYSFEVTSSDLMVLRDPVGRIVASEGDPIYIGGGEDPEDPGAFKACGYVSRDPP